MSKAIELMKRREEEILKLIKKISRRTNLFSDPKLILIGGYALRAFIPFTRYTRDCDFALRKTRGWKIDKLKEIMPKDYSVEAFEKRGTYSFLRCIKFVKYDRLRIKVSIDFMEGEIRGREEKEIILIDEKMIENRKFVKIPIADDFVKLPVPSYVDYFIMKVVSARPSDIRDIASLILDNGIPKEVRRRIKEILPYPEIFQIKLSRRIIPEIKGKTFLNSWRGAFATTRYTEGDRQKIIKELQELSHSIQANMP